MHSDLGIQDDKLLSIISKRRRKNCLRVPSFNTTTYQNCYQYNDITMFNK